MCRLGAEFLLSVRNVRLFVILTKADHYPGAKNTQHQDLLLFHPAWLFHKRTLAPATKKVDEIGASLYGSGILQLLRIMSMPRLPFLTLVLSLLLALCQTGRQRQALPQAYAQYLDAVAAGSPPLLMPDSFFDYPLAEGKRAILDPHRSWGKYVSLQNSAALEYANAFFAACAAQAHFPPDLRAKPHANGYSLVYEWRGQDERIKQLLQTARPSWFSPWSAWAAIMLRKRGIGGLSYPITGNPQPNPLS